MASSGRSTWWLYLIVAVAAASTPANSDPQTNELAIGCSSVYPQNKTDFFSRLNATFSGLRTQLSKGDAWFATAERVSSREPVYALVQCRKYLSIADCLACHDAAESEIQKCRPSMGARVTYDGCFLRYEGYNFYKKTNENALMCGDNPAQAGFLAMAQSLLKDLYRRAPKTDDKFATGKKVDRGTKSTVYAVAQCLETVTREGCKSCLAAAFESIVNCLYASEGRLTDTACFMRFSDTPFFDD